MVTHSGIPAWSIPGTEEPGRLQSTGSQRVGRDRAREHTRIVLWFKRRRDTFSVKNLPPTSCYWPPASSPSAAVQRVCPLLPRCYALSLLVSQACPALCDPVACCPPGSSVPGMLQARILEWVAMPSSRGSSQSADGTQVSRIVGGFFTM